MKQILYFTGTWCQPCKNLGPIIDKLSSNINVNKIDVDNNKELVMKFNVKSIPTVILLENGNEIRRFVGSKSENEVLTFIQA